MSEEQKTLTNRDPKAGCIIMIIGAVIFGGLIAYTLTTPFKQSGLMQEFTELEPMEIATSETLSSPPAALVQKLTQISTQVKEAPTTTFSLSVEELNQAIRSYVEFQELQGTLQVVEITPEEMEFQISFPLRGRPFSDETPHLNGKLFAVPAVMNDEVVLNATRIESRAGEVPEGFLMHFQPYRIMSKYSEHEQLGRAMFSCKEVTLSEGAVTLTLDGEAYADPEAVKYQGPDMEKKKKQTTVMTVCSFLLVGVLFIFLVRRRNAQSAKAIQEME